MGRNIDFPGNSPTHLKHGSQRSTLQAIYVLFFAEKVKATLSESN